LDPIDESGKVQVPDRHAMAEVAAKIAQLNPRPTAIFVRADIIASGLHHALPAVGIRPGVDIEIVGTNNDAVLLDQLHPRPVSVDIHVEQVGRRAVEQLYWRLDHSREPRQIVQIEPEIAVK
jgi:DNA-binding LacI/PurR family transcriptional regulator